MNTEVGQISESLKSNKLTLNINKTFYIVFHRCRICRKCLGDIELFIDDTKTTKNQ